MLKKNKMGVLEKLKKLMIEDDGKTLPKSYNTVHFEALLKANIGYYEIKNWGRNILVIFANMIIKAPF